MTASWLHRDPRTRTRAREWEWERERERGSERGSASVLSIAILGALVLLSSGVVTVTGAAVTKQRVSGAADAAALAAADAASGAHAGIPCREAERLAAANNAVIVDCSVEGAVVAVTATAHYLGFDVTIEARAGPPRGEASAP
jgi:secretion/DNA translocation related TadE-like protein